MKSKWIGHFKAMLVRHGFSGFFLLLVNSVIQPVADNLNTLTFNRITWKGIVKFSFKWMAPNQFSALMLYLTNPVIKKYFVWLFGCLDRWWPDRIFYVNRVITFWPSRSQNCSRQITGDVPHRRTLHGWTWHKSSCIRPADCSMWGSLPGLLQPEDLLCL